LFGIEYQTAKDAKVTCAAIPQRFRCPNLSYGHHQAVAGRDDKVELLEWAVETQATVREVRAEKKRRQLQEQHGVEFAEGVDSYSSNLPTNALELLDKRRDPLEDGLLLGQVSGIQRAHLGQDAV
jgi:hypothetical protein